MSGFDTGVAGQSVVAVAKQSGSILRGINPPVPATGVVGDLYIDETTWQLFGKRANGLTNPWGNYLFVVPAPYRTGLKWFSTSKPSNKVGVDGDYCMLWGSYNGYGLALHAYGPKAAGAWPGSVTDIAITVNTTFSALNTHSI